MDYIADTQFILNFSKPYTLSKEELILFQLIQIAIKVKDCHTLDRYIRLSDRGEENLKVSYKLYDKLKIEYLYNKYYRTLLNFEGSNYRLDGLACTDMDPEIEFRFHKLDRYEKYPIGVSYIKIRWNNDIIISEDERDS